MNGLTMNELCCLFCCPPCPSKIVAKLAFLPPPATYKLLINDDQTGANAPQENGDINKTETTKSNGSANSKDSDKTTPPSEQTALANNEKQKVDTPETAADFGNRNSTSFMDRIRKSTQHLCSGLVCSKSHGQMQNGAYQQLHTNAKIVMMDKAEWQYGPMELEKLEVFLARTEMGHQIACLHVRCTPTPKYTILFSHGNAVDLGQMSSFYYGLGSRLDCNIFTYDYSGYGASGSTPTEKNLYCDIQAAWNALRIKYGVSPSNIILYGQSIGTVPTVDLASKYDCAGVVLHAPLMSGMRVAFNTSRTWCCDAFPSIDKMHKIGSLVLVIHGTDDEVIDLAHGIAIHEKCQRPVDPLWVEGAGHNDVEIYSQYVERLKRFINEEIRNHQYSIMAANHAQQVATALALSAQTTQPKGDEKAPIQSTLIEPSNAPPAASD